jgi:hypothetical protein
MVMPIYKAKLFSQAVGGRMAYCPECGAEFHAEIRRCPECQVDLLEELEEPSLFDLQEENLVLIKSASSSEEAKRIKELLQRNGILCVVEEPKQPRTTAAHGTMHVLVNQKDEPRSQDIINSHFK